MKITEFGIFSVICVVLIPLLILIIGILFRKKNLPRINLFLGYRTPLSMKNKDTWEVANRTLGKVWLWAGSITLPVSLISVFPFLNDSENTLETAITIISFLQVLIIILTIIPVEKKLRNSFDENGNKKDNNH